MKNSLLSNSLLKLFPFNEAELNYFHSKLEEMNLSPHDNLINVGERCDFVAFIEVGDIRQYCVINGDEITINFFCCGEWVSDHHSFLNSCLSANTLTAVNTVRLKKISVKSIHELFSFSKNFLMLNKLISHLSLNSDFVTKLKVINPEERYKLLLSQRPDWIKKYQQKHLASLLGMTPETLSRVRRKAFK